MKWAVIAMAGFLVPASASDVTDAVHAWMGKWPSLPFNNQPGPESMRGPAGTDDRTFWQFPGTRVGLEAAVGKTRAAVLIGVRTTGDNLKMAGPRWATFMACMPHNCGGNEAQVFIDTVSGRFNVCWSENAVSLWLSPGGGVLPLGKGCYGQDSDEAKLIAHYAR
jgi:hypothetical protein